MHNYSYLRPPARAQGIIGQSTVPGERAIFSVGEEDCSNKQIQALHRLKEYLKHKNPNHQYDDSVLLRYCFLGEFQTAESVEKIKYYDDWEALPDKPKDKIRSILHSGVFYCYGHDETYSPTIYFCPEKINLDKFEITHYLSSLKTLLEPVLNHMLVPGHIQQWNLVVDLQGFNNKKLQSNFEVIQNNFKKIVYAYPYRLKRIFLLQQSSSLLGWKSSRSGADNSVARMVKYLGLENKCIEVSHGSGLDQYIPRSEREVKYGGELQNLHEYWPITSTNRLMEVNSRFIEQTEQSSSYFSVQNKDNEEYFYEDNQRSALCDMKRFCSLF